MVKIIPCKPCAIKVKIKPNKKFMIMGKFKVNSIDLKIMGNIRGGG
jgi:hypothetical protein